MEIPEGWSKNRITDIAIIKVGRDLIENSFSKERSSTHRFPVYSNTVEEHGVYGFYNFKEYDGNCLTIVGRGIGLGTAFARKTGFGAIGRLLVLSPKSNSFDAGFLAEYVNSYLRIFYESGGIPQLPGSTLAKYKVILPPIKEQKKIAEVLSTWDRAIETVEKLIENSQVQKRALMQQLLTGKKRLLGFNGEWKEIKLGDIATIYQPRTISQKDLTQRGYPVWGANGRIGFYDQYNHDTWQSIITCRGSTCGTVNKTSGKSWITGNAMVINVDDRDSIDKLFIYYKLGQCNFVPLIGGSGQPQITRQPLQNFVIQLPKAAEEQIAISTILSYADREIGILKDTLENLKTEKSALMQQLLTGKRRVKVEEMAA